MHGGWANTTPELRECGTRSSRSRLLTHFMCTQQIVQCYQWRVANERRWICTQHGAPVCGCAFFVFSVFFCVIFVFVCFLGCVFVVFLCFVVPLVLNLPSHQPPLRITPPPLYSPPLDRPKFRSFFTFPPQITFFHLPREIVAAVRSGGHPQCAFWLSGVILCETQRSHRERRKNEICDGRGKSAKCWASPNFGPPYPSRLPTRRASPPFEHGHWRARVLVRRCASRVQIQPLWCQSKLWHVVRVQRRVTRANTDMVKPDRGQQSENTNSFWKAPRQQQARNSFV